MVRAELRPLPEPGSGAPPSSPADERVRRNARWALWLFVVFLVVGAWALLFHLGRYFWFNGDEWDFLVNRNGGSLADLIRAHNEHPSFLPIIVYRILWNLFGLRHYIAYQIPVVALHLTAAALLRALMRRAGVNAWIATAVAASFILFGPGEENIIWAFQIGFTGSLVFGLGHLLLADHDGDFDRRDWIALAVGFCGLLCSGLAPMYAVVVGVVVLVKRGWRPALFQSLPIVVGYLAWVVIIGVDRIQDPYHRSTDPGAILHFVKTGEIATFLGLGGGNHLVAGVLAVVLVVGLVVAWIYCAPNERLRRLIVPVALLLGGLLFLFVSGYGRWWIDPNVGASSRYVHLVAGFTLPALAVAFDELFRRWKVAGVVAALVLVSAIPHNIGQFDTLFGFNGKYFAGRRELIAAMARSPYITQVPQTTRPDALWSSFDDAWLVDALHSGKLPPVKNPRDINDPTFRLRFGLAQIKAPAPGVCSVIRKPVDVSLRRGDELGVKVGPWKKPHSGWFFTQSFTMQLLQHGKPTGQSLLVFPDNGNLLRAQLDHLDVRFALAPGTDSFILCR
jgi:hypothetical protein